MTKLHVAIIPDGNRRWAKQKSWLPWKGHEAGSEAIDKLTEWCRQDGRVGTITFWCFSTENWKRDSQEVEKIMELLESYLTNNREKLKVNRIHLVRSGRRDRIAPHLLSLLDDIDRDTAENPVLTMHLALDYGGKDEVVRAVQSLRDKADITDQDIRLALDRPELPDIDLVIRTSGEQRTSNFCLWQSAYAEWMFVPDYFPDFTPEKLDSALASFEQRQRRFGK
jgi:undecaprenyl diphosphate synthase